MVFSHSPLQKIYKGWNFWTEDADDIQALLKPFDKVNVIYGHVHQIQYNQIGNISFNSVMATAWPWPYPQSYAQAQSFLPKLTVPMNRADPFFERDATGWQFINVATGKTELNYNLYNNSVRKVAFNRATGEPEDTVYQAARRAHRAADPLLIPGEADHGKTQTLDPHRPAGPLGGHCWPMAWQPASADEFTAGGPQALGCASSRASCSRAARSGPTASSARTASPARSAIRMAPIRTRRPIRNSRSRWAGSCRSGK